LRKDYKVGRQNNEAFSYWKIAKNWVAPVWFKEQIDPRSPYYQVNAAFSNRTSRRWTTVRGGNSGGEAWVDRNGVVYLPENRVSLEVWLNVEGRLIDPGKYEQVVQRCSAAGRGVITGYTQAGVCREVEIIAREKGVGLVLRHRGRPQNDLYPALLMVVIRPYDGNGFSPLRRLFIKNSILFTDHGALLKLANEPDVSYFTDLRFGDIPNYLESREGNTGSKSAVGLCTGFIGFFGRAAESDIIEMTICLKERTGRLIRKIMKGSRSFIFHPSPAAAPESQRVELKSGTILDELYRDGIKHLDTFSPEAAPETVNLYQIMVLNRFDRLPRSRSYLRECCERVGWNGFLAPEYLGVDKLIFAVADYYYFSRDRDFIARYWPAFKKVAYRMLQRYPESSGPTASEKADPYFFWRCASFRELVKLGGFINKGEETREFKARYLEEFRGRYDWLSQTEASLLTGAELLDNLVWFYPLRFWKGGNSASNWVAEIKSRSLHQNLFIAPSEFAGAGLEHTARLGQILTLMGDDFLPLLANFLDLAGPTWNWPDYIHPVTKGGVGATGHDPLVLYQVLLWLRILLVDETEEGIHLLPGMAAHVFGERPKLRLAGLSTRFGAFSLEWETIGDMAQLKFESDFHAKPGWIMIKPGQYQPVYSDVPFKLYGNGLFLRRGNWVLRFGKRQVKACLDNTFSAKI